MELGAVFISLMGGPPSQSRPFATWVDQAERLFHTMEDAGFTFSVFSHAYQASLAGGMQPTPLIARLAPVSGNMRLAVQVLLLPLLNPMDVAYNVASLDQITEGRLDLGIGLGYHPMELEPSGIPRSQRASRFEESVEVLRKFWSNAPVEHKGRYYSVSGTHLSLPLVQTPHPPLWGSCHSHGAAARAGRTLEGMVAGPQVRFDDLTTLVSTFRQSWSESHDEAPSRIGAWRPVLVGNDPADAYEQAVTGGRLTFPRYQGGAMQEATMVPLALELRADDVAEWAIMGDYSEILAGLRNCADTVGLTHTTCQFYNLPTDFDAKLEWLKDFGPEVIAKL